MAIQKIIDNLWSAVQAPYFHRWKTAAFIDSIDQSIGNGYSYTWLDNGNNPNQLGLNELEVIGVDLDNALRIGAAVKNPTRQPVTVHLYPNANLVNQTFFINPTNRSLSITGLNAVFTTAGTVAGATASITHETTPLGAATQQAPGTGASVMTGTFNLHGTAETVQNGVLAANYLRASRGNSSASSNAGTGVIVLAPGDSLSIVFGGTLTTLVGVTITLYLAPGGKFHFASYVGATAAAQATTSLLTAMRPRTLLYAGALWSVAGSDAGTVTVALSKDASATAPGAGTAMTSAATSLKTTANTYTQLPLSATAANLSLNSTDSAAVKFAGTLTALAGVCVTLAFDGKQDDVQVDYNASNSTAGTNEEIFIADRDYELIDVAGKWSVISTSNTAGLTADTGTQTPSTGTILQTDNTNAGFLTSGTVNTPVFGTLQPENKRFLRAGDRLGIVNAGTLGSLAGLQMSARLRPM